MGLIVFTVLAGYWIMCFFASVALKYHLLSLRFDYGFGFACDDFETMFEGDPLDYYQKARHDWYYIYW